MGHRVLHVAARLTRGGRQRQLKIQASWPWPTDIATAWHRISAGATVLPLVTGHLIR